MEEEKRAVIFKLKAEHSIFSIYCYIAAQGYPETAEKFYDKLYDFGNSLVVFPKRYPPCK